MTNETTASQPKAQPDTSETATKWAETFYRNADSFTLRDLGIVQAAWAEASARCRAPAAQASATIQAAPIGYARRWHINGEKPAKERKENGRMAWPIRFKFLAVSERKCLSDDEPLYAAATIQEPVMVAEPVGENINGPMTDAQKQEARHLYRNLHHLGPDAMEDVVRYASVCGYVNGRKDFAEPAAPMVADPAGVAFDREEFIRQVSMSVAEMDRDSPEGQPEMMLVTPEELQNTMRSMFELFDEAATVKAVPVVADPAGVAAGKALYEAERPQLLVPKDWPFEDLPEASQAEFNRRAATVKAVPSEALAWVIETGDVSAPLYRTIECGMYEWTRSHMKAIRFARRDDAEMFAAEDSDPIRICQHAWPDAAPLDDKTGGGE